MSHSVLNVEEAIAYNKKESKKVYFDLPSDCERDYEAEGWTGLTHEPQLRCISKGHGTAKVLLIGNSYGYRAFPVLHEIFAGRYAEFRLFTKSSRMFLNKDKFDYAELVKRVVMHSKPDLVFVIEKDMGAAQNRAFSGPVEEDHIFNFTQARISFLSERSGRVVIDDQFYKPRLAVGVATTIKDRLRNGQTSIADFEDLKITREEYLEEFKFAQLRLNALKGDNLIKNRVQDLICEDDSCYFFNRENLHAYYGDLALHQTTEMLEKMRPGYHLIVEQFLKDHTGRANVAAEFAGKGCLKAFNGRYLRVNGVVNGKWLVDLADWCKSSKQWFIEERDGKVVLQNKHHRGWFLRAQTDGSVSMTETPAEMDEWTPLKNADGSWSLQSADGRWLSAHRGDGTICTMPHNMRCERFSLDMWS